MRVYISGPISLGGALSVEQIADNLLAFDDAADWLKTEGHEPVSPVAPDELEARRPWRENMIIALHKLLDCDAILLLPDWHLSKGARIERDLAVHLELEVISR